MTLPKRLLVWGLPVLLLTIVLAAPVLAQEGAAPSGLSGQSLRPYRFVFYAFAICWALVLGWVVSVGRRMAQLDRRLGK